MTRNEWKQVWRAARLTPRKWAAMAAFKAINIDNIPPALHCWLRREENRYGIDCAKAVRSNGLSFSKCISIHLRAIKYRNDRRRLGYSGVR